MIQTMAEPLSQFSEDIVEFMNRLRLLYEVPFSYLVTEEAVLPPESIRFFYIDGNWTEALVQGALSVGRVSEADGISDWTLQRLSMSTVNRQLRQIRLQLMHENHKRGLKETEGRAASNFQTGFLIRSGLVRNRKGLEIMGKNGDTRLEVLRLEALADDILIGLFDGELTDLVIAEPKTGLRFGSSDDTREIKVRSVTDDDSFGKYLNDTVDLKQFTQAGGKLDVSRLAQKFGSILGHEIGAAELAFELIAVAQRAEFVKK